MSKVLCHSPKGNSIGNSHGIITTTHLKITCLKHDDAIKWKHFPRYWPFVWGIYWSPVNSPHKGEWRGVLMFSLICAWTNGCANAGDLRRHHAHSDVTVINQSLISMGRWVNMYVPGCYFSIRVYVLLTDNIKMTPNGKISVLVPTKNRHPHYNDVIMGVIASQITSLTLVYSAVYSDADQRKDQSSASLAFVRGIHRGPVNSPQKWPVTRKMFPFDDVIMQIQPIKENYEADQ